MKRWKIGVFDSGLGGLSVLRTLWKEVTGVDFVYFADLENAPYGGKSKTEVKELSEFVVKHLLDKGCEAILFACNTATSASAEELRKKFSVPIFGMEPALKPAALENPGCSISVFATELTLAEEKFKALAEPFLEKNEILQVPCEGLAKWIDEDEWDRAWDFLHSKIESIYHKSDVFVLGCTHYVLLKERIHYHYPSSKVYDGNLGTSIHMKNALGLLNDPESKNQLDILLNTSNPNYVHLANRIAKSITGSHTVSLFYDDSGKVHV